MAMYNYRCKDCSQGDDPANWVIWEESHGMNERPKIQCPKCKKHNTEKCYVGYEAPSFHTRGYGWLDTKGRRRDMHLWKLMNDDPYRGMRKPGEKAELAHQLRKGGKHDPKAKKFYMPSSKRPSAG